MKYFFLSFTFRVHSSTYFNWIKKVKKTTYFSKIKKNYPKTYRFEAAQQQQQQQQSHALKQHDHSSSSSSSTKFDVAPLPPSKLPEKPYVDYNSEMVISGRKVVDAITKPELLDKTKPALPPKPSKPNPPPRLTQHHEKAVVDVNSATDVNDTKTGNPGVGLTSRWDCSSSFFVLKIKIFGWVSLIEFFNFFFLLTCEKYEFCIYFVYL